MKIDPELRRHLRAPAIASLVLLLLLGVNVLIGVTQPFHGSGYVGIAIAGVMVAVVLLFTMDVREEAGLIQLFSVLGFFWLAILFGLTVVDYVSR